MKKKINWNKAAKYAMFGLLAAFLLLGIVIPAAEIILGRVCNFLLDYLYEHPLLFLIIIGVVIYIGWKVFEECTYQPPEPPKPVQLPEPTESDYFAALPTIRAALAEVADSLGLAPITSSTDMAVDRDERILTQNGYWGLVYKAKKKPGITFDTALAMRVLQAQIKTVLERDNPSRLSAISYNDNGVLKPVFQVADVDDGDVFVKFYIVTASDVYFRQKHYDEERRDTIKTEADADDTDF